MKADAVFEGGGVRGAAYCSAVDVFERAGFAWQRVAGTSAGAIVAAFIACGIDAAGILELLTRTDFRAFLDFEWRPWRRWRLAGEFRGDAFERWMRAAIGDRRMGETLIPLHVITSDLRNAVALEISSRSHPLLEVARAVRMSMSIPHFFCASTGPWSDVPAVHRRRRHAELSDRHFRRRRRAAMADDRFPARRTDRRSVDCWRARIAGARRGRIHAERTRTRPRRTQRIPLCPNRRRRDLLAKFSTHRSREANSAVQRNARRKGVPAAVARRRRVRWVCEAVPGAVRQITLGMECRLQYLALSTRRGHNVPVPR
jgi:hypothetical protein